MVSTEVGDELERCTGISHIVSNEQVGAGEVHRIEKRRQQHREVQALVKAGVELHVHGEDVLHAQCIGDCSGRQKPAASDCKDDIGLVAAVRDQLGERTSRVAEQLPAHDLAVAGVSHDVPRCVAPR